MLKGKHTMVKLEFATEKDANQCYAIIDMGRRFQKEQGFTQWTDDYPNFDTVCDDIRNKKGYVVKVDGVIAGYMCIDFDGEPAYNDIDGKWSIEAEYAVVHRMAFAKQFCGIGLSDTVWSLIEELCKTKNVNYIRVDTDFPNKRMQHILNKNGFKCCGVILFQGSGKIAFDKVF